MQRKTLTFEGLSGTPQANKQISLTLRITHAYVLPAVLLSILALCSHRHQILIPSSQMTNTSMGLSLQDTGGQL
jgi:hypothetical protein